MNQTHPKPRIAIPVPTSHDLAYNDRCWPQYAAALAAEGGDPVRINLGLVPEETARLIASCQAILLPGSPSDVNPQKYGQAPLPTTAKPDLPREATDELLLQDAFNLRKPLLGVCFGLQMMNVWRGGTLTQHLATAQPHAPGTGAGPLSHGIAVASEARILRSLYLDRAGVRVNSSHHQAVDVVGDDLLVAATAEDDGVVEALEGSSPEQHFVLGVQWHPERIYEEDEPSRALFIEFLAAAHRWKLPNG